jgi:TrmH family RNA methyltransferase
MLLSMKPWILKEILSLQHPRVKHLAKLRQDRDYRYEKRRLLLSGSRLIQELPSYVPVCALFLEKGEEAPVRAEETFLVTPQILKKITGLENPEGIAAEIEIPPSQEVSSAQFLLILDRVSDPGNLGTLLRSARALGWDGAFLTPGCTDPWNEKALRAAKGATFTLPWKAGTWEELCALLKNQNMQLLAADASGKDCATCQTRPPLALALGNESQGLSKELQDIAERIAIPMMGRIESLNVAAAGAILMHQLKRSFHGQR